MSDAEGDEPSRLRKLAPIALAVVAVLLLALVFKLDDTGPDILVLGDSVTFLSTGAIRSSYGNIGVQVTSKIGYRSDQLLPLLRQAKKEGDYSRVGLLVGYNDIVNDQVDSPALPEMVRQSADFDCAVWLGLPTKKGGPTPTDSKYTERAEEWNQRLRDLAGRYGNVHVSNEWAAAVDNADAAGLLGDNSVHPLEPGQVVLADAYRQSLRRYCR